MDVSSIRSKNTIILSNSIKYITKTIIRVKNFSFLAIYFNIASIQYYLCKKRKENYYV